MCKCLIDVPKNTLEFLQERSPDVKIIEVGIIGIGFLFGKGNMATKTYNEYEYKIERKTKKGTIATTKKRITLIHSFCPFCGKEYPKTK